MIASAIQNPGQEINEDGAPNQMGNGQVPPAAFPTAVQISQLAGPVVVSRTSQSQRKRRSKNGAAKTAQQQRRSNNGAATTAQQQRRSNNGAETTAQQQRRSNNGAATTAQ